MENSKHLKQELDSISGQIKLLQLKERELNVKLLRAIESESDIKKGDIVELYKTNYSGQKKMIGEGIFLGMYTSYGEMCYRVAKIKKDGTASKNEWSKYDFSSIQKIAK
jgi:hypothetical protein